MQQPQYFDGLVQLRISRLSEAKLVLVEVDADGLRRVFPLGLFVERPILQQFATGFKARFQVWMGCDLQQIGQLMDVGLELRIN